MRLLFFLPVLALLSGCGEKPSTGAEKEEPTDPASDPATPSAAGSPGKESSPALLSDADVERLLKEAVDFESIEERDGLIYQDNKPYSGWWKEMYDSGQASRLAEVKDGKPDGLMIEWYENGQKSGEGTLKDGKEDGPVTMWHKTGQKLAEETYKDGEKVSAKYWNSKGEEVETLDEAKK